MLGCVRAATDQPERQPGHDSAHGLAEPHQPAAAPAGDAGAHPCVTEPDARVPDVWGLRPKVLAAPDAVVRHTEVRSVRPKHCKQRQCQASIRLPSEGLRTLGIDLPTSTYLPTKASSRIVNAGVAGSSDWGAKWAGGSRPQPGRRRQYAAPQLRQPPGPAGQSISGFLGIAAQGIIRDHASWTAEDIKILGVSGPSHLLAENQPRWCRQRHMCCKSQQIAA